MLFKQLGLRDFARIDGWFLPSSLNILASEENVGKFGVTKSGKVIFTDINLVNYNSKICLICVFHIELLTFSCLTFLHIQIYYIR